MYYRHILYVYIKWVIQSTNFLYTRNYGSTIYFYLFIYLLNSCIFSNLNQCLNLFYNFHNQNTFFNYRVVGTLKVLNVGIILYLYIYFF